MLFFQMVNKQKPVLVTFHYPIMEKVFGGVAPATGTVQCSKCDTLNVYGTARCYRCGENLDVGKDDLVHPDTSKFSPEIDNGRPPGM